MSTMAQLDGIRRANRMSIAFLCSKADMAPRTYARRLKDPNSLTMGEVKKLKKALRLKQVII